MKRVEFARLIVAIGQDDVAELSQALDRGVDPRAIGGPDDASLLGEALARGSAKCAKALLDRGCATGPAGLEEGALWRAARGGSGACVELVVAAGASVEALVPEDDAVGAGLSVLMGSWLWGSGEGSRALLRAGADPLRWHEPTGRACMATALAASLWGGEEEGFDAALDAVEAAAKRGGAQAKKARQASLDTALCVAAQAANAKAARRLLDLGASLDYEHAGPEGCRALDLALEAEAEDGMARVAECFAALWERATPEQLAHNKGRTRISVNAMLASLADVSRFDALIERVEAIRLGRELRRDIPADALARGKGARV